jgi:hypothetical protein
MMRKFVLIPLVGLVLGIPAWVAADQNNPQPAVVSADPVNNTPFVQDGRVEAVAKLGNRVYVAGNFTKVKNWQGASPVQNRSFLFAYNVANGQIDTAFNPILNGPVVDLVVAPDGSGVFAGGAFSAVNGLTRVGLVKLDPATGATVAAFTAATSGGGGVFDMDIGGSKLYLTGTFTKVKGKVRTRLAAVDVTTGAVDSDLTLALTDQSTVGTLTPWIKVHHLDVSADGSKLMLVGEFGAVGGVPRSQVALINLATSPDSVADWSTDKYISYGYRTIATSVAMDPTGTYAVVVATCCPLYGPDGVPTVLGDHAARFELTSTGLVQPTWYSATPTDTFTDVAISGTAVYVGGHFRWVNAKSAGNSAGGVARAGIAALDPDNGVPFNWNAGRDRGYGIFDSILTEDQLIIGHDTNVVGGEWHPRLAAFPLVGGIVPPPVLTPALPVNLYSLPSVPGDVLTRSFDGAVIGAPTVTSNGDWSWVRGAFTNGQYLYAGSADGKLYRLTFDGVTWGSSVDLSTRTDYVGGSATNFFLVEAMAHVNKGLLYTRTGGDTKLYWSGFNLESGIIGGNEYVVAGNGDGNDWSGVRSLAIVGTTLYFTSVDGNLRSVPMNGRVPGPLAIATVISGPAIDGVDWSGQELVIVD